MKIIHRFNVTSGWVICLRSLVYTGCHSTKCEAGLKLGLYEFWAQRTWKGSWQAANQIPSNEPLQLWGPSRVKTEAPPNWAKILSIKERECNTARQKGRNREKSSISPFLCISTFIKTINHEFNRANTVKICVCVWACKVIFLWDCREFPVSILRPWTTERRRERWT